MNGEKIPSGCCVDKTGKVRHIERLHLELELIRVAVPFTSNPPFRINGLIISIVSKLLHEYM